MRAGPLRHKVTIQSLTDTQDSRGGLTESWATYTHAWADIVPLVGRELERARQIDAEVDHRFVVRYQPGIIPKMRLVYGTRTFDISAVINRNQRDRTMDIFAVEKV